MNIQTPEWVRHAVFYQIFPDRFAFSAAVAKPAFLEPWDSAPTVHGYKGGDLLGVAEHMDYLHDLGVTALYFTPVFTSAANHRYHTHDYFTIDPILGGNAAFRTMLDAAHARGIRVVLDGVFNHASRGFYQFNHTLENGPHSPYLDWFQFRQLPPNAYDLTKPPGYEAWWGYHALPKFNTATPAVREFLFSVAEYWIRQGIDGWRLDVPGEIADDSFWQEFRARVKAINPDAYIVGEIWNDSRHWLQGDQFDAVMNYLFAERVIAFTIGAHLDKPLVRDQGWDPGHPLDGAGFALAIGTLLDLYPTEITEVQLNLLDSHDTARFLTMARGDVTALTLATLFQMTYPGAPSIYYGDEIGMEGRRDPDCRRTFPWDPARWNMGLRDYFKQAIAMRRAHPALRTGVYQGLYASDGVYAFARALGDDYVVVAMNTSRARRLLHLPVTDALSGSGPWQILLGEGQAVVQGSVLEVALPPRGGLALAPPLR
ncbi:MAG TPA: glycoside hydrolase family 13 protein [Chloroflexia bacterium]|nr:glycoside hydrolase family 13 protein [Chloroflexia bacterium]